MLVSMKWLKTMVDLPQEANDIKALCDSLDMTGTGVEGVQRTGDSLDHVFVGQILSKERHPDSDHMWVTTVDVGQANLGADGNPEPLQIVCGAQNFEAGDKVIVAMIGAVLPGDFKIKKSKLRGVQSFGMNCSGRELGISSDHEGIMILPADAPVGMPAADYLAVADTILDLEITPNRPDCMSMLGMARELGAIYDVDTTFEPPVLVESEVSVSSKVKVTIEDPQRCPRYTARVIENVKIGQTPAWMTERITASGARPINNVVDVTNYILFELGQPLHAFDMDCFAKDEQGMAHVVVRRAHEGEPFATLDGIDRILTADMTVIADGNSPCTFEGADPASGTPVALAGVMGGLDSEVTEKTHTILLESATFDPGCTSRTSRNLQLFSESSARYERGVDAATCDLFSSYAAALMAEVSSGTVCKGVVDEYPLPAERPQLELRPDRLRALVGDDIPNDFMVNALERLGCELDSSNPDCMKVIAPTFRPDLVREIDLYEEVLRLWGTEKVPDTILTGTGGGYTESQIRSEQIGQIMRACGLNETLTYSFVPTDDLERSRMTSITNALDVQIINPLSSEMGVLRHTLIPGLLRSVAHNQSRGVSNVHLYETGAIFEGVEGQPQPKEPNRLACVLTGAWCDEAWNQDTRAIDFFDAKGIIETLIRELAIAKLRFKAIEEDDAPWLQPGAAARVLCGKRKIGWLGVIHPEVCAAFEVAPPVIAFELDMEVLIVLARLCRPYEDIPQFPAVDMDMAIVVDESVSCQEILDAIRSAGGSMVTSAKLFDVYRDEEKLGAGLKSMAFSIEYRDPARTLTSQEAEKRHAKVVEKVCKATGGKIR